MQCFKIIFSGVTFFQGGEFAIFLLTFAWTLQQCSATALLVIKPLNCQRIREIRPEEWSQLQAYITKYDTRALSQNSVNYFCETKNADVFAGISTNPPMKLLT